MSGLDAILFDLDGVLVDSYPVWFNVLNAALAEQGRGPITELQFEGTWGQSAEHDRSLWFPELTLREMEATYARHYLDFVDSVRVMDGAADLVTRLRERGFKTAVVTNSPRPIADRVLTAVGLIALFQAVVTGSDVARAKPAPDMLLAASQALAVPPARALMLGDTENDRNAARAAGCPFVHFGRDITRLSELLDRVGAAKGTDGHP